MVPSEATQNINLIVVRLKYILTLISQFDIKTISYVIHSSYLVQCKAVNTKILQRINTLIFSVVWHTKFQENSLENSEGSTSHTAVDTKRLHY